MKTIKDAVMALNGKLPDENEQGCFRSLCAAIYYVEGDSGIRLGSFEEFESEAKRLGYINGYRWGVEYPTNGKRPDLADDVLVHGRYDFLQNEWGEDNQVAGEAAWHHITAFRITDQRHKPADTNYLNQCKYSGVTDVDQLKVKCMHLIDDKPVGDDGLEIIEKYLSKPDDSLSGRAVMANEMSKLGRKAAAELADDVDNAIRESVRELISDPSNQLATNWHERGEPPPVGVECEICFNGNNSPTGFRGVVTYRSGNFTVIVYSNGDERCYRPDELEGAEFRPIRTEREKVIEAALNVNAHTSKQDTRDMMVAVIHKLYDAGMLVLPPKKSDTED